MGNYDWKYCSLGGVVRVKISSGEDIAHLGELDQKLWTVLSCPVNGLQFDQDTLKMLDTDADGKIRAAEIIAAAEWLTSVIKDKDSILKGRDVLRLENIDCSTEEGKVLRESAGKILAALGLKKEEISVSDTSDSVAIFAKTQFNGDGIITPASADDEALKALITTIVEKTAEPSMDRSGVAGINTDQIEAFYAACADYAAWKKAAEDGKDTIFPYGGNSAAAFAACEAIKDKVADYFMRCKLIGFDDALAAAVDVSAEKIGAISAENLATRIDDIATHPFARPSKDAVLSYDGINPAWEAAFDSVKALVLDVDFPGKDSVTEDEWNSVIAKFAPYVAWCSSKKGDAVEALGLDAINGILAADCKAQLLDLIEKDKAVAPESEAIDRVNKLTHLYRDFFKLLNNYVCMIDFYAREKAVFEVGKLYIDQRCCDLCINVADMGQHADMASQSGMFLIYCTCTSKVKAATMNIVAVMTDGSVRDLRPGKNAVFYDRDGQDWDAVVTKIVDNPISVKAAFWSPYRKFANTITERINKSAAEKENKVNASMTTSASNLNVPADGSAPAPAPASKFDIAKFAGIFAAVGMGLGMIGSALMAIIQPWYNVLVLFVVLIVIISGPSMFIAWQKLRKRNLGPVLNANGWAINSIVLVNVPFGRTLTSVAKYPHLNLEDPYAVKTPWWKKAVLWIVLLCGIFAGLYFTNCLKCVGLPYEKAQVEQVVGEQPVETTSTESVAQ